MKIDNVQTLEPSEFMIGGFYRFKRAGNKTFSDFELMTPWIFQMALTKKIEVWPIFITDRVHTLLGGHHTMNAVKYSPEELKNELVRRQHGVQGSSLASRKTIIFADSYVYLEELGFESKRSDLVVLYDIKDNTEPMMCHRFQQLYKITFNQEITLKNI